MQHAWRDAEIHGIPSAIQPHRRVKFERDRKLARLVEDKPEPPAAGSDAPVGMLGEFRQRDSAREQRERAALRICHARRGGEGERRILFREMAGELKVAQHDLARFRISHRDF